MKKLQEIRKKKNLTQKELSIASGVPLTKIKKYESGEIDINNAAASTLFRISIVLKCRIEDLLEEDVKQVAINSINQHFKDEINKLVETEMDTGCHDDYPEDYDTLYDFYVSNVKLDSYKECISYRFSDLEAYLDLDSIQEEIINIIKEKCENNEE